MEYGEMPEQESRYFAKTALPEIIPVLLSLLTRQDEDADEDELQLEKLEQVARIVNSVPTGMHPQVRFMFSSLNFG